MVAEEEDESGERGVSKARKRSVSRTREASTMRARPKASTKGPKAALSEDQRKQVLKKERSLERHVFRHAKRGEADRMHWPKLVKHMNSGKSQGVKTSTIGR